MSVLSAQTILRVSPIYPLISEQRVAFNMTYGIGPGGYDLRVAEDVYLIGPFRRFALASTIERFDMPNHLLGVVHDKSSWIRRGLTVGNTVIEPGWRGYLTVELIFHRWGGLHIKPGTPIAQVTFHTLDQPTDRPYVGRYQDQKPGPQPAMVAK